MGRGREKKSLFLIIFIAVHVKNIMKILYIYLGFYFFKIIVYFSLYFFPLPFITLIPCSTSAHPPLPSHHTVVHVHEFFILSAWSCHPSTRSPLPGAVSLLSIYDSVFILLVSCLLDPTYEWSHMVFVVLYQGFYLKFSSLTTFNDINPIDILT